MQTSFLSRGRWRIVGWITALLSGVLFVYVIYVLIELYKATMGGAV